MHSGRNACWLGICRYMPFHRCARNVAVPYEPELLVGVPRAVGSFDRRSQGQIGGADPDRDQGFSGKPHGRLLPVGFLDNQLERLQPLTLLGIIPVAHANQGGAVLFNQSFGPSLPRFENQTRFHAALRKNGDALMPGPKA